ncbi:MAG: putative zinc-binding metallopeptidase, partial [Mucilaginibacter polytrichastri]|nr:putative zinc-binding metallopeptidase [Mucilaginibacter polytrichastri]
MKVFACDNCGHLVFFENTRCEKCGHDLGFCAEDLQLHALEPADDGKFTLQNKDDKSYRYCVNHAHNVCNWLVEDSGDGLFCTACRHNRVIPDLTNQDHLDRWSKVERAKHRLIYQLIKLGLPLPTKSEDPIKGLSFDFMSDTGTEKKVMTGHDNGLITLNITEADDVEREMTRRQMQEAYRTLLGHFRHEIGHYYWDMLIDNTDNLLAYRDLFGDDRVDYQQAIDKHYENGAPADWQSSYISAYAAMHPW